MVDPFKITKIRQSVWDRLNEFRAFLDGGKVRQYRTKWTTSLSDSVAVLLDIQKELEKTGWKFVRITGKWGYGYTGEVELIPPSPEPDVPLKIMGVPDQDLMDLMKDGEQIQDDTETDS